MHQRSSLHHTRIPMGCDQQGRYPEAAEHDGDPPCYKEILIVVLSTVIITALLAALL